MTDFTHPTDYGYESYIASNDYISQQEFDNWRKQYLDAKNVDVTTYMNPSEIAMRNRLKEMVNDAKLIVSACEAKGIEAGISTSMNDAGASVYVTFGENHIRLSDHDCQRAQGVYIKFFYPCTDSVKTFVEKI